MEAKAMVHAMNADFIEQDVVMMKGDQLVSLHNHFLDGVANVATAFPHEKPLMAVFMLSTAP